MMHSYAQLGRAAFIILALLGALTAVRAPRDRSPGSIIPDDQNTPEDTTGDLAWKALALAGRDPFREDRKPTSPRYLPFDPDSESDEGQVPEPPTPRPEWTLTGVLWGAQPLALFDGIPPEESSGILAQGDSVGPIIVARIAPDTVYLRGRGAAWTFTIESPWKAGGNP